MFDDPNFAYTYLRPLAVMAGYSIAFALGWHWRDRQLRKRAEREKQARAVAR